MHESDSPPFIGMGRTKTRRAHETRARKILGSDTKVIGVHTMNEIWLDGLTRPARSHVHRSNDAGTEALVA